MMQSPPPKKTRGVPSQGERGAADRGLPYKEDWGGGACWGKGGREWEEDGH